MALQLLVAPLVLLPHASLLLPQDPSRAHPQASKLIMTAMILSGDPLKTGTFRSKLPNFCFSHGDQVQNHSIGHISKDGGSFCVSKEIDPFLPPAKFLLEFLLQEFRKEKGRGYSSLSTMRSAISAIAIIDDEPAGQHPLVCRFVKAAFLERPFVSRHHTAWDPDVVLAYLRSFGPNESLSLIQLPKKLVMLMLLVSGDRGHTLHLLDTRNMTVAHF